eukprot:4825450-Pyramimonas_sp.AAC.1
MSRTLSDPPSTSSGAPVWDAFDRGSAAGRALFKLYDGDCSGKKIGNRISQRNAAVQSRLVAEGLLVPKKVDPSKWGRREASSASFSNPKGWVDLWKRFGNTGQGLLLRYSKHVRLLFGGTAHHPNHRKLIGTCESLGTCRLQAQRVEPKVSVPIVYGAPQDVDRFENPGRPGYGGGKRKEDVIKITNQILDLEIQAQPTPEPARALIGDKEKSRYARHLEFNGAPPPDITIESIREKNAMKAPAKKLTRLEELEKLFDEITVEINDRHKVGMWTVFLLIPKCEEHSGQVCAICASAHCYNAPLSYKGPRTKPLTFDGPDNMSMSPQHNPFNTVAT